MNRPLVWVPPMPGLVDRAPSSLDVEEFPENPEQAERLGEVEFIITSPARPNLGQLIAEMPSLKVIQTVSAGVDGMIPMVPDGVTLCSARGSYEVVAEWVVGAILADFKGLPGFRDAQNEGRWISAGVRRLKGATVLLLGYGGIAKSVEERLAPFGVEVLRVARHARPGVATLAELPELLPKADVVVLLVPLTSETDGLVDSDFLAKMRPGALLVNAARGRIVDNAAMIDALREGRISAVIDVTDPEPLPEHHDLFAVPNLLITPHVAGGALAQNEVVAFLVSQLERFAVGEPLANIVTEGY